jgi:serine-type anaerobic sulfatase-maturating enzyme
MNPEPMNLEPPLADNVAMLLPMVPQSGSRLATVSGAVPRITSLLVKPASAVCNLDCEYCFYLERATGPYQGRKRTMSLATLERLVSGYLACSFPLSAFSFQGGEPTLAGLDFSRALVKLQQQYGRPGQTIANSMQTNGILLDGAWCDLFKKYSFLIGLSLDGPEDVHDRYRVTRKREGSWTRVMSGLRQLQRHDVDFNILCVVSQANVARAVEIYRFFRALGVERMQFIPLAEFEPDGTPLSSTISADEYGAFLCEIFEEWWPERTRVRVRFFDNLAEAIAGVKPGCCTMHESCDSYVVVEYTGDVYPCDFFVETGWKLGNVAADSWPEIARRQRRLTFASKKLVPHAECSVCEYQQICHGGCPKLRHAQNGRFEDLDWFCGGYKRIFARAVPPLREEISQLLAGDSPRELRS